MSPSARALCCWWLVWLVPIAHGADLEGKKVLHINSYHEGYAWSDGIMNGVKNVLKRTPVELRFHFMNTKNHRSEDFMRQAGLRAKAEIEKFRPDVVIVADDHAVQYVLQAHYQNAKLPFVFCGVNWDVQGYDLPYANTTGMVEVSQVVKTIEYLRQYAKGERLGILGSDTSSNHKDPIHHAKLYGIEYQQIYWVNTMAEWKEAYLRAQDEVDALVITSYAGLDQWQDRAMKKFILENTRIPTGTMVLPSPWMTLLGVIKVAEEQGSWAAKSALKILQGTKPTDIPIARNRLSRLQVNLPLAHKLKIQLSPEMLRKARRKVLFGN